MSEEELGRKKEKRSFLLLSLTLFISLLLPSCGFRPLYNHQTTITGGSTSLDAVWIDNIGNASGLALRNALIDRFYHHGTPENPPYILHVALTESSRDLALSRSDVTTRAQLVLRAEYTLMERSTRRVIDKGSIRASNSYNILLSQYTTLVTQAQSRDQAIQELADKLTLRTGMMLEQMAPQ